MVQMFPVSAQSAKRTRFSCNNQSMGKNAGTLLVNHVIHQNNYLISRRDISSFNNIRLFEMISLLKTFSFQEPCKYNYIIDENP